MEHKTGLYQSLKRFKEALKQLAATIIKEARWRNG